MSLTLIQEDWTRFMDRQGLAEKSGVPPHRFRDMILKELTDNACDIGGATIAFEKPDVVTIKDTGPGIDLDTLSIKRPLVSSKHWRRGERGALGNGLRAVMGALYVLEGHLIVGTNGTCHKVWLDDQGDTQTAILGSFDEVGTSINVICPGIAGSVPFAETAINLQNGKVISATRPSPLWFDRATIIDMQRGADGISAKDFVAEFGTRYKPEPDVMVVDLDAGKLLTDMCEQAMKMPRINPIGDVWSGEYVKFGSGIANLPCVIEVWANAKEDPDGDVSVVTIMNRTRALQGITISVGAKGRLMLNTGGRYHPLPASLRDKNTLRQKVGFDFVISISAPFIPILSSGKTPDLSDIAVDILQAAAKAGRKAQAKIRRKKKGMTIGAAVAELLPDAYARVSDSGRYWANARQLMYAMRPHILLMCGIDKFADDTVTQKAIPQFQSDNLTLTAGWRIAYDNRGHLIEPHTGRSVGLGTIEVQRYTTARPAVAYDRAVDHLGMMPNLEPEHRYSGLLFVEKEGFTQLITQSGILARNDIALASTKGMSVIAIRKLIDDLAGRVENFTLYVVSDFDIAGQGIAYTLTSDSERYTFKNRIDVVHLGVTWVQAQELHKEGLSEPVAGDQDKHAYRLLERGLDPEAVDFLTGYEPRRVEINALTSVALLRMLEYGIDGQKVIPPQDVLTHGWHELQVQLKLAEHERQIREKDAPEAPDDLADQIDKMMADDPALSWDAAVLQIIEGG